MTEQLAFRLGQRIRKVGRTPYAIPVGSTGRITKIVKKDLNGGPAFYPYCVDWDKETLTTLTDMRKGYPMLPLELEAIDA